MLKSSSLCLYSSNLGISIMMSFLTYITGIFYERWTFTDFDRLCKLEKRGDEIKKNLLLWNYWINGHLGYRTALTDTIFKGDHLRIISAKFGWDWLSSFRGEDFFFISSPLFSNLHNRSKAVLYPRWPP
jgi:hypothetical protein